MSGFKAKPLYTYVWPTGVEPQPLNDERKRLKLAESRGYTHDEVYDPDCFVRLYKAMNERKGQDPGISLAKLTDFFGSLHAQGLLVPKNIRLGTEVVSVDYVLGNGTGTGYAVIKASKEEEMAYGVSGLHTMIILDSFKDRYTEIDFCGANVPDVARFKAAMGLSLKLFFQVAT